MNWLDPVLVVVAVAAVLGGFRLGFITRSVSWAGMALGLFAGLWIIPPVLRAIRAGSSQSQLFLAAVAMLVVSAGVGQAIGLVAGSRISHVIHSRVGRRVDQVCGAFAGLLGVTVMVWLLAPSMATVPGTAARGARGSAVIRAIDRTFPRAPDATRSLSRLIGSASPQVFQALRLTPQVGPVPAVSGLTQQQSQQVAASTVRVVGRACALIQEGSGVVLGTNTIVTNAHVVAGEQATTVQTRDGRTLTAQIMAFDPNRDVAVLHVPNLGLAALPMSGAAEGERGAVFGYPGGGDLKVSPYRVSELVTAVGTDIYDLGPTRRPILILASHLARGDSGGALINTEGQVAGLAFAISPDRPGVAYALQLEEVRAVLAQVTGSPVRTGRCIA